MNAYPVSFAIGCFHFGLKKTYSNGMKRGEYLQELRKSLEDIPNINNIEIVADDYFESLSIEPGESFTPLDEGQTFFPPPSLFLEIHFDIYIPERLQNELYAGASTDINTEKFQVYIKDSYHFPVTFIELIDTKNDTAPSTAVIVVREFLVRQFAEKGSEYIRFDCLGPSPFHANFFLSEDEDKSDKGNSYDTKGFFVNYLPQRGYDTFDIHFSNNYFSSLQEAKKSLFRELSAEAGMFYRIVHQNVLQMEAWGKLEGLVNDLIKTTKLTGLKAIWFQTFRLYQQVQEVIFSLSEFESNRIWTSFFIKTGHQQLMSDGTKLYLQGQLDAEVSQFPDYPVSQIKDVVNLLESRRSKTIDNFVVLIAALIGGVIGAVITKLFIP